MWREALALIDAVGNQTSLEFWPGYTEQIE